MKSRGEAPVVGLGGAPPEGDDSAIKTNVQFLALAYINIQIAAYSCKVFFGADRVEIAQPSDSRKCCSSRFNDFTPLRASCRRLTLMKPMCIDSRHVCAEATHDSTLVTLPFTDNNMIRKNFLHRKLFMDTY